MKIKELIKKLEEFDPEMEVLLYNDEWDSYNEPFIFPRDLKKIDDKWDEGVKYNLITFSKEEKETKYYKSLAKTNKKIDEAVTKKVCVIS